MLSKNRKLKVCVTANKAWNLVNFRLNQMRALQSEGFEVHAVAPPDEYVEQLEAEGMVLRGI